MRVLSRAQAIDDLRRALLRRTSDAESACAVTGRLGIFCRGHRRLSDAELEQSYDWIVARQRPKSRAALEDLANRWELARQSVTGLELACDVQSEERDTCPGWTGFSDDELAAHYRAMLGEAVRVESTMLVRIRAR